MDANKKDKTVSLQLEMSLDVYDRLKQGAQAAGFESVGAYMRHCVLRTVAPELLELAEEDRYARQLLGQHAALTAACDAFFNAIKNQKALDREGLPDVVNTYWQLRHDLESVVNSSTDESISFEVVKRK